MSHLPIFISRISYSPDFTSSHKVDPDWQRTFSIIWSSFLALFVLLALPHLIRSIRNGRAYNTLSGISKHLKDKGDYSAAGTGVSISRVSSGENRGWIAFLRNLCSAIGSVFYWTVPGLSLDVGQSRYFKLLLESSFMIPVLIFPVFSTYSRSLRHHSRRLYSSRCPTPKQWQSTW